MHYSAKAASVAAALLAFAVYAQNAEERGPAAVDEARILAADDEPGQWLSYGRTYDEQRYSPLTQIHTGNVAELGLAWFADIPLNQGQEATPIVVDGVMYLSSSWSNVFAFDAATGAQLWRYDPEVPRDWAVNVCCGVVNRGVAAWNGKIYVGTLDGRLVALDAATGLEVWSALTIDRSERYSITGAVRVVKGRVLVGNSGGEFGVRGYVSAYDAETGELDWRFWTVPGNPADGFENEAMEMAAETWNGEWWTLGGGGTAWDALVYDPVSDLVYIGVGNGSPWNQALRSPGGGDNLFLASIVAVDPDDGAYVWHYQTTPGETWDFTATQPIIVADLELTGVPRRVVMQAPKNGFFYVLDAATGELISADAFAPVNWASHVDLETGRPVENPDARYDRTGRVAYVTPTGGGAHNWRPMSFSPKTGLVYFGSRHSAQAYLGDPDFTPTSIGTNTGIIRALAPEVEAELAAHPDLQFEDRGAMMGWDPVARRPRWRVVDPDNAPAWGGTLATAGDLVFAGGGRGELIAYRAEDGERVWRFTAQTGVAAGPISYAVDGVQYVAVAAGRGLQPYYQPNYSRVLAFRLGGTAELPPMQEYVPPPLNPPPSTASEQVIARGAEIYGQHCAQCHDNRIGTFPDLRTSAALANPEYFNAVVLGGALAVNGMASFAAELGADDAEAAREYIITLAHEAKAAEDARTAADDVGQGLPLFEVDPSWPKALPYNWTYGHAPSVAVDSRDHVFILTRPNTLAPDVRARAAPPVIELDPEGYFVNAWGGPSDDYDWPDSEHGIAIDFEDNVWIGGSAPVAPSLRELNDDMLLKFTRNGEFLLQIGGRDASPTSLGQDGGNRDGASVHQSADAAIYEATREVFVADGYGNRRVAVFDATTGTFKRAWGAFGNEPVDVIPETRVVGEAVSGPAGGGPGQARTLDTEGAGSPQFNSPVHAIKVSNDGKVYVADRSNRRIQVFTIDGEFETQMFINREGPSSDSAAGLAFSPDPEQRFLYVADYGNSRIAVVDRQRLEVLYQFGQRSAEPGDFRGLHHLAVDSQGNIYTGEVAPGARVQKFRFVGMSTTHPTSLETPHR